MAVKYSVAPLVTNIAAMLLTAVVLSSHCTLSVHYGYDVTQLLHVGAYWPGCYLLSLSLASSACSQALARAASGDEAADGEAAEVQGESEESEDWQGQDEAAGMAGELSGEEEPEEGTEEFGDEWHGGEKEEGDGEEDSLSSGAKEEEQAEAGDTTHQDQQLAGAKDGSKTLGQSEECAPMRDFMRQQTELARMLSGMTVPPATAAALMVQQQAMFPCYGGMPLGMF